MAFMFRSVSKPHYFSKFVRFVDGSLDARNQLFVTAQRLTRARWRGLSASVVTVQPWRLIVGICSVIVPAVLMGLISSDLPVSTPGIVLLLPVAFSAYFADWMGGVTALVLSSIALNILFVSDRNLIGLPHRGSEAAGFLVTLICGGVIIWLIERIKRQSADDRLALVAARSAASAFTSLKSIAASQKPGDAGGRRQLFESVVRALVGIHRAHAGALFLKSESDDGLEFSASYGFGFADDIDRDTRAFGLALAEHVAQEQRPVVIDDIQTDTRFRIASEARLSVRSFIAAPILGLDGTFHGVAMIGLLVPHHFTGSEIAKLAALSRQVAAILETASVVDARESLLQRARDEQRRLELVIASLPEAVVLAAPPDGKIVATNGAAATLFGSVTGSDLSGCLFLPDGEPCPIDELPVMKSLKSGEVEVGVELLARRPDGTDASVLASAAPVREPDGTIVAIVAAFHDIGALKQASQLKDEFVSVVSHELRSPLTPIRGFVQLVARDLDRQGGHDSHVQRLRSIEGHVDRMTRLVDDLLDVSGLKSGSLDIRRAPADLVSIANDVVQVRAVSTTTHRISLDFRVGSIVGDWDADRLQQVIDNLVGNAIKYSPDRGNIQVTIEEDHETGDALLTVSDDGPGILPDDRQRIFAAFYRTDAASSSQVSGLGLGLYICHELVAAHGGTIEVGSAQSGGAAFTVRLPRTTQAIAA